MGRFRARMAIYALAGVYLLYRAWNMFKGLETAGEEKTVMMIFIALFGIIGLALVSGGIYASFAAAKKQAEENKKK